jgi:hypothetical protein
MKSFTDALRALNTLVDDGVLKDYAVAGAMAMVFWTEPVPTYDLDVLVLLPETPDRLVSLDGLYRWAEQRGFPASDEHLMIYGVPTQFLPSPSPLTDEALREAALVQYEDVPVRVVRPEHLIALYLEPAARSARRRERAALLMELPSLNRDLLGEIMARHGLDF